MTARRGVVCCRSQPRCAEPDSDIEKRFHDYKLDLTDDVKESSTTCQ
jgi:hypothetical protein